jgi:amino-acid N-acetyltransferase
MSNTDTIDWFRNTAPYINTHRGTTVVVGLRAGAVSSENFINVVHDLALMHSLGMRLVIIHEHDALENAPLTHDAMSALLGAISLERSQIERMFSMGLPNSPLHNAKLRVISGNFVTARPAGVLQGIDHGALGIVRQVDVAGVTHALDGAAICLLSTIGHSAAGDVFAVNALELMRVVSRSLSAEKLIVMSAHEGVTTADGDLARQLTVDAARGCIASAPAGMDENIMLACDACDAGVQRVHLVSYSCDGGLIKELYTHDGAGTLVSSDEYEQIVTAQNHDLAGILELIRPLQQEGILADRPNEQIAKDLECFTVITKDSRVIACAALHPNMTDAIGEIACVATHPDYRESGHGERLIEKLVENARELDLKQVYVRTTQTGHWFRELGFKPIDGDALPPAEQAKSSRDRNSNTLIRATQ